MPIQTKHAFVMVRIELKGREDWFMTDVLAVGKSLRDLRPRSRNLLAAASIQVC